MLLYIPLRILQAALLAQFLLPSELLGLLFL